MAEREPHGISPEDIAPTEDTTTGTADGPDVYAANRELERWLYGGVNQDNDDRLPTTQACDLTGEMMHTMLEELFMQKSVMKQVKLWA